jgi:hypothetical protein
MDATTRAIVGGLLVMPLRSWPTMCIHLENHASWEENTEAKVALGPTIANWIASGKLEYIPIGALAPMVIEPVGSVPKSSSPWHRLITDGRAANHIFEPWSVKYHTVRDVILGLSPADFLFCVDIADAYHTAAFAGCMRGVIEETTTWIDRNGNPAVRVQKFLGCSPRTCSGACDKCFSGIMLEGSIYRFACCQFGKATAHGPLNAYLQTLIRFCAAQDPPLALRAWVDDLVGSIRAKQHKLCSGLDGGCPVCAENFKPAQAAYEKFRLLCRQCHIWLSEGKGFSPAQKGAFTGLIIDTIRGFLTASPEKLQGVVACLLELLSADRAPRKLIAKGQGKIVHYSQAVPYLGPVMAEFAMAIRADDTGKINWNRSVPLSTAFQAAVQYSIDTITRWGHVGRPMWPLPASTAYHIFLSRRIPNAKTAALIWDASIHGWGAVLRTSPEDQGLVMVGTFSPDEQQWLSEQVWREARAGVLAFRAATQSVSLQGWTVIMRNDATGALAALRKGSTRSSVLQRSAIEFTALVRDLSVEPLFLHAAGTTLVQEGIDGLSREAAIAVGGPAVGPTIKYGIRKIEETMGLRVSIDLFASCANRLVERFYSQFAEAGSEGVDAFAQPNWNSSVCPACGKRHREFFYAFPPPALIPAFIRKASADRAWGILLVPFSPSAAYWPKLLNAELGEAEVYTNPAKWLLHAGSYRPQSLALMVVDFGKTPGRLLDVVTSPPCGQEAKLRPRATWESPLDAGDRDRIRIRRDLFDEARRLRDAETTPPGASPP